MTIPDTSTGDSRHLRFILVETSRAGNVGAAARAMKTMGFSELVLVRPRDPAVLHDAEAIAFASGAQDLLQAARIVDTIGEALEGCNFAAAVSARLREYSPPVLTPRMLAERLADQLTDHTTDHMTDHLNDHVSDHVTTGKGVRPALIFGNERTGLPNDIVEKCTVLINIPANPAYSSLNLAQAVQVLAYECAQGSVGLTLPGVAANGAVGAGAALEAELAAVGQIEAMYVHLEVALTAIGFLDPANPRKLMSRLRRLFSRTGLETEEVNILRGMARQMQERARK